MISKTALKGSYVGPDLIHYVSKFYMNEASLEQCNSKCELLYYAAVLI